MSAENWKDIKGYEGLYKINIKGDVQKMINGNNIPSICPLCGDKLIIEPSHNYCPNNYNISHKDDSQNTHYSYMEYAEGTHRIFYHQYCAIIINGVNATGFCGITNNVIVRRIFVANLLDRIVSVGSPNETVSSITYNQAASSVAVTVQPNLYYSVFSPPKYFKAPEKSYYSYHDYTFYNNQAISNAPAAGGQLNWTSTQTIQVDQIPKCIYLWPTLKQATSKLATDSDAPGAYFTSIKVNIFDKDSQFSSLNASTNNNMPYEMYRVLCAEQGYIKSFEECSNVPLQNTGNNVDVLPLFGSVLRIPGEYLIGIDWDTETVATQKKANLVVNATGYLCDKAAVVPAYLNILVVTEAIACIDHTSGTASIIRGFVDNALVKKIRQSQGVYPKPTLMMGSSFFGNIWNGIKDAGRYIARHKDVILPVVRTVAKVAGVPTFGLGRKPVKHLAVKHHARHNLRGGYIDDENENENSQDENCMEELEELEEIDNYKGGSLITRKDLKSRAF